jgi:energy-coupling factor transport system substrate-specific component
MSSPSHSGRACALAPSGLRLRTRSWLVLLLASVIGLVAFFWPFLADPGSAIVGHSKDAPWLFAILLVVVLAVVLTQIADGSMDSRAVALLGVLAAVATALRPVGAGTIGFEPIWVVIILGGRALGPGFGFTLGNVALFSSALLTGGVGPWLPFQMIAAGWLGLGAGLLPRTRPSREPWVLAAYAAVASLAYGFLLNLWFWPWGAGSTTGLSYVPGAAVLDNLQTWMLFNLATSLGYDIPRAIVVSLLILVTARPVLAAIRRNTRRAAFDDPGRFVPAPQAVT